MVKLIVIADDFTGTLDTGIQFVKHGIKTQVFTKLPENTELIANTTEVVAIDAETRPLSPEEAYEKIKKIIAWSEKLHADIIFKKTDSALRGNIGSELQAVLDQSRENTLYFLPGYPDIDRLTKGGTQYIAGELLENSVFGKDPFEPAVKSYIPDIIKEQSDIKVQCLSRNQKIGTQAHEESSIVVCDVEEKEDINNRIIDLMENNQLHLLAGCAALANGLAEVMDFQKGQTGSYEKTKCLLVSCGSLNRITQKQIDYAEHKGFVRKHLTMQQKLNPDYYQTDEGKKFLKEINTICTSNAKVIIDSFDIGEDISDYLKKNHIQMNTVRKAIPRAHGMIADHLAKEKNDCTILMTGGDTLMGYMELIDCTQLCPICEIEPGIALSVLKNQGVKQQVISKSGGFGTEDVLEQIADKIVIKGAKT